MRLSNINLTSKLNEAAYSSKKPVGVKFKSRRAEIIAWTIFFGIGVSYFVATLIVTCF